MNTALLDLRDQIKLDEDRIRMPEQILGKGLNQPFNNCNSAPRKIMYGIHQEHNLCLMNPEPPLVGTGHETQFAEKSSYIAKADQDYTVIATIDKFYNAPSKYHYFILVKTNDNVLDIIERKSYEKSSEDYGFLMNNDYLDSLTPGSKIIKNVMYKKSNGFDENNNRSEGVNLLSGYIISSKTQEDSIIVSKSAAAKLASPLIHTVEIMKNENDIFLNLYGDDNNYKTFPNIGENVNGSILCALRREQKNEALFAQSFQRLKTMMISDEKYSVDGKVIDIDIYCNNPENIANNIYNNQLNTYYQESLRFAREFVRVVDSAISTYKCKMTYNLEKMYEKNKAITENKLFIDNKAFSNVIIKFTLLEINEVGKGDKLSDRFGGKGVISDIWDDELMGMTPDGKCREILFNALGSVNRDNPGRHFEDEIISVGLCIIDYIKEHNLPTMEAMELYCRYLDHVSPRYGKFVKQMTVNCYMNGDTEELDQYLDSILNDRGIRISVEPISESFDLDKLNALYKDFEGIVKDFSIMVPMRDSNGNIRYLEGRRKMPCGMKYIYRLKQYSLDKFSVTSLSSTNIRNENSRNNASKFHKGLYKRTPIRFGEMETSDEANMGIVKVLINLMVNSASPIARREMESLLTGDPFNINITIDEHCRNRNVEILNTYFKTMGLRLEFIKKLKKRIPGLVKAGLVEPTPGLIKIKPGLIDIKTGLINKEDKDKINI